MAFTYIIHGETTERTLIGVTENLEKEIKRLNRNEGRTFVKYKAYAVYEMAEGANLDFIYKIIEPLDRGAVPKSKRIMNYSEKEKVGRYRITVDNAYRILQCIAEVTETEDRLHRTTEDGSGYIDSDSAPESPKEKNGDTPSPSQVKKPRGPKITFEELGIPEGAVLHYKKDPSITAVVKEGNKVECNGQKDKLSPITLGLLGRGGSVRGSDYWTFGDERETLTQMSERLKREKDEK